MILEGRLDGVKSSNLIICCYSGQDRDMIYRVFKNEDGNVPVARFIAVSILPLPSFFNKTVS